MLIKCLSFGAPTLTDQYPFDDQKRKTGMLPFRIAIAAKEISKKKYLTLGSALKNKFTYLPENMK